MIWHFNKVIVSLSTLLETLLICRIMLRLPAELLINAFKVHSDISPVCILHNLKFFTRGITTPYLTQQWFNLLQNPSLLPLVEKHPRVLMKLQQPYLRHGLGVEQRWNMLQQHYSFVLETFPPHTLKDILISSGPILTEFDFPNVGHLSVRLRYSSTSDKEGELSLVLYDELKKEMVFALTFCMYSWQPNSRKFIIGGLQGFKLAHDREYIVNLTRAMYGLRPKSLLLFVLQTLASLWSVHEIHAVSNEARHLYHKNEKIMADYDQFWQESGGHLDSDGYFNLPVIFTQRLMDDIKPRKRSMYRRRYEMLEEIERHIRQNISQLTRNCSVEPNLDSNEYGIGGK